MYCEKKDKDGASRREGYEDLKERLINVEPEGSHESLQEEDDPK